jgi:hypothetical protein
MQKRKSEQVSTHFGCHTLVSSPGRVLKYYIAAKRKEKQQQQLHQAVDQQTILPGAKLDSWTKDSSSITLPSRRDALNQSFSNTTTGFASQLLRSNAAKQLGDYQASLLKNFADENHRVSHVPMDALSALPQTFGSDGMRNESGSSYQYS